MKLDTKEYSVGSYFYRNNSKEKLYLIKDFLYSYIEKQWYVKYIPLYSYVFEYSEGQMPLDELFNTCSLMVN